MTRMAAILLIALLAGACGQRAGLEPVASPDDAEFAKSYFALFQSRDFAAIERVIDPGLRGRQLRPKLEQLAAVFPRETPKNVRVIAAQTSTAGDMRNATLSLEYEFTGAWVVATVGLQRAGGGVVVKGVDIESVPDSVERLNRFTLSGKGAGHYIFLAWAIGVPALIVYTLVRAIRAPRSKLKWLWCLAVIPGVAQFGLNWTTGQLQISPLGIQLLGTGFVDLGPYGPLVISTSIPVGAIGFWLTRRKPLPPVSADEE